MKQMTSISIWLFILIIVLTACTGEASVTKEADDKGPSTNTSAEASDDAVVVIAGETLTRGDLDFYTLMEKIKIELNRAEDESNLSGAERDDKMEYWDDQLKQYENLNIGLQSMIEINAMSLLAEEKSYFVPDDKLADNVSDFADKVKGNKAADKLITAYGEDEYQFEVRDYIRKSTLRDRVAADLADEIKETNPDISELEQNFLLNDKFEELYMDQIASLEVEIKLK